MKRKRVIIMGAAGRDFHNFNMFFRNNTAYEVVAFTATQIPDIDDRIYPPALAGENYPEGIPIYPESDLSKLVEEKDIDIVVFSYSDIKHQYVMHKASEIQAVGADFWLLGPHSTQLKSRIPVIGICAVRTGCGKSQTTRKISQMLKQKGKRVVIVRHPMPYGNLENQICERFAEFKDLERYNCTIEEREEYEQHLANNIVVYAGVDYEKILRAAEAEADIIIWDGGNNDFPFFKTDLLIVVTDALRPGHEHTYYPGETNLRMADVVIINKIDTACREDIAVVEKNIKQVNQNCTILKAQSPVTVSDPALIRDKEVLIIEDGPTLTHGEMKFGAGLIAAQKYKAKKIVDPRPYVLGKIKQTFNNYPDIGHVLPAMGYGKKQIKDLERTVDRIPCESVIIGTPIDLNRVIKIKKKNVRVTYELKITSRANNLTKILDKFIAKIAQANPAGKV